MFWILALMTATLQPASPQLDFEFYRTRVEPILLERKEGFTRCVVCHTEGSVGFLQELESGADTWTEEQSRANFESLMRFVTPGQPTESRLLMHPLEPAAGGDEFHNGGRQFSSQEDPWFVTLSEWVNGATVQ